MNKAEKQVELEYTARKRAVKGWSFRGLPKDQNDAIMAFLNGGPCPEGYRKLYDLAREQLKLGPKDWYEAFADAAHGLVPNWDAAVDLTPEQEHYCEAAADSIAERPEAENDRPEPY